MRTFRVKSGDLFYTPQIDGVPCVDSTFEVPPGFDQLCDGLVVPWIFPTNEGLVITEEVLHAADPVPVLRCVVGPLQSEQQEIEDRDWLQFHSHDWEPLAQDKWTPLGKRHMMMGTIGGSVDVQLTFRDARGYRSGVPANLYEVVRFDRAVLAAQPHDVLLNIFDLASALTLPNAVFCNTMCNFAGAFHAAVEVYGEEWSFYRTPNPTSCGVCKSLRPRRHPVHVYRQSMLLGQTHLKDWEVRYLIRAQMAPKWVGGDYELLGRNCIHFCDELLFGLGVKRVPNWVTCLHETGYSILRIPWPLSICFGSSDLHPLELPSSETHAALSDADEDDKMSESQSSCGRQSSERFTPSLPPPGTVSPSRILSPSISWMPRLNPLPSGEVVGALPPSAITGSATPDGVR